MFGGETPPPTPPLTLMLKFYYIGNVRYVALCMQQAKIGAIIKMCKISVFYTIRVRRNSSKIVGGARLYPVENIRKFLNPVQKIEHHYVNCVRYISLLFLCGDLIHLDY